MAKKDHLYPRTLINTTNCKYVFRRYFMYKFYMKNIASEELHFDNIHFGIPFSPNSK